MDERVIVASRVRVLLVLIGAAVFVALGAWLLQMPSGEQALAGWASIVFFGGCFLLGLAQLFRPGRLILRSDALTIELSVGRPTRIPWRDIASFVIFAFGRTRSVCFRYVEGRAPRTFMTRFNQAFGVDAGLPNNLPISPEALLALLNEYKSRAP